MAKLWRIFNLIDIPAIVPSILVAVVHFKLSILVGPQANVVFQRWFDTGERASGVDAVVASVDAFLAKPIPTVLLARHPVYGPASEWWIATAVNSFLWGAAIYACCKLPSRLLKLLNTTGR